MDSWDGLMGQAAEVFPLAGMRPIEAGFLHQNKYNKRRQVVVKTFACLCNKLAAISASGGAGCPGWRGKTPATGTTPQAQSSVA
jgi:hypothetical protein